MKDGKFLKQMEEEIVVIPERSTPVFVKEDSIPVPVKRFEQLLEAEIRLDILKKTLMDKQGITFLDKEEVKKILGMEAFKGE